MKTVQICLNSIDKVKAFVNEITKFDIMGIFSLDLSKPIDLCIHADESGIEEILNVLKPYLV